MIFSGCEGLTSVYIPNSVKILEKGTFKDCKGLKTVTIPNSVEEIGMHIFAGCTSLSSIYIPSSVKRIDSYAFASCTSLSSMIVDDNNSKYDSRNNCIAIIETENNKLVAGCKSTIIPNSVTTIGTCAFDGCNEISSIDIPNSVTTIGYAAFSNCLGLKIFTIPKSIEYIDSYAFSGCENLETVVSLLEEPCSMSKREVFHKNTLYLGTLYVPEGTITKYKNKQGWQDFKNIVEGTPASIKTVDFFDINENNSRYLLNGQKIDRPIKGVNLVRMKDGKIKKILER